MIAVEGDVGDERLDDDWRWQAVIKRDRVYDGLFYYAVRTTGVYCRPTCPARRPKRANVEFFDTTALAERAGFRPCMRCRPLSLTVEQRVVAHVQQFVSTSTRCSTLAQLGKALGMSPSHVHRIFRAATGLSPREYAAAHQAQELKIALPQAPSVTSALYEVGYGSSRALYEAAAAQLGMRPASYKRAGKGERITFGIGDSPLGPMLIATTTRGVCALRFGERDALIAELTAEFGEATLVEHYESVAELLAATVAYLNQRGPLPASPLDCRGTAFQQRVWDALRAIPVGETRTYRELAEAIGEPSATRAVARACAANPVALLVPCHRVRRSDGGLGGYRWGIERKRDLRAREQEPSD